MPVEPETAKFIERIGSLPDRRPGHGVGVEEARRGTAATAGWGSAGPEVAMTCTAHVPVTTVRSQEIDVRVHSPANPRATLVYFHGGGWVLGHIDGYDAFARALAVASGCAVVLVNYRKAPEFRFPTQLSDAEAGLRWAADDLPAVEGMHELPVIVAGDSAGGNLAAVLARRERDRRGGNDALPQPIGQILVYPVTDHDLDRASYLDDDNQLFLTRDAMAWYWDHYAPEPADRDDPDAAPIRASDLTGVAPAAVITAEYDVLRDEGEAYADRLEAAGVLRRRVRMVGQTHGFANRYGLLPGSTELIALMSEAVDEFQV